MFFANRRATVQTLILLGIAAFILISGWACDCGSGSDLPGGSFTTRESPSALNGHIDRWHDFSENSFTASGKDLQTLMDALQQGGGIGLLVPQAQGASEPGILAFNPEQGVFIQWDDGTETLRYIQVPITSSLTLAAQLTDLMPPPAGSQWQALVPLPGAWQTEVPTQTTTFQNVFGSLHYELDFKGDDYCNHCEVKLTACSATDALSGSQQAALRVFGADRVVADDEVTCANPVPTYIMAEVGMGVPLPGPVIASFGPYGGTVYTTTVQSEVVIPYSLRHTSQLTQTFQLAAISSARGWDYAWQNLAGDPITQTIVGPLGDNLWTSYEKNLKVVASGLPACAQIQDTIHLTATLVSTPTIQATAVTVVDVLPDPSGCIVADLGVSQIASSPVISAGNWVTYTLVVTNFEVTAQDAVLTQTIVPTAAVGSSLLPAGCTINEAVITCQVAGVAPGGSTSLEIPVQAAPAFSGVMQSSVEVQPSGGADAHYYDNLAGPLAVSVAAGPPPVSEWQIFLPFLGMK